MIFKKLEILGARTSQNVLERFAAGIVSKCLVCVEVSQSHKKHYYIMENGSRRRIRGTDDFCPQCVEPRQEDQSTYCESVHGDARRYCRLCGAELRITMMIDGPVTPAFGAVSTHYIKSLNSRIRANTVRFFNGAKIFTPAPSQSISEEQA